MWGLSLQGPSVSCAVSYDARMSEIYFVSESPCTMRRRRPIHFFGPGLPPSRARQGRPRDRREDVKEACQKFGPESE